MKIIELIPSLQGGGAERLVCELSNEFVTKHNIDCTILAMHDINGDEQYLRYLDSRVLIDGLKKENGFQLSMFWKIFRYLKKSKPDVVHVHTLAINYILLATLLCPKIRFYATIHSAAKREAGGLVPTLLRKIMFKFNLCKPITISEESKQSFTDFYKLDSFLIENGCSAYIDKNINPLEKLSYKHIFVNIASIQVVKNQTMLVSVFNRLITEGNDVCLLLIGRNGLFKEMDEYISNYLSDRIRYIGEVDNPRDYMKYADAFCLSSLMEGLPMTIIEAFSVGCIPICTPVGGCKSVIGDGVNGLLSKNTDEEEYYKVIKRYLNLSPIQKTEIKKKSEECFIRYSITNASLKYIQLFESKI